MRTNSQGGHGCNFAVSEVASGWDGEIPDAIGFRNEPTRTDTIVVEVKISRNDFLADKKKPHRSGKTKGMGNWRYYMCPTDLIKPEDLPPKFGLLYVNTRGHVKLIVCPFTTTHYDNREKALNKMKFDSDKDREMFLMTKLLSRLGNVEEANEKYKKIHAMKSGLENRISLLERKNREYRENNIRLEREIRRNKRS